RLGHQPLTTRVLDEAVADLGLGDAVVRRLRWPEEPDRADHDAVPGDRSAPPGVAAGPQRRGVEVVLAWELRVPARAPLAAPDRRDVVGGPEREPEPLGVDDGWDH